MLFEKKYSLPSYSSGDGTYGVPRFSVHAAASVPSGSWRAGEADGVERAPRKPLVAKIIPSPATGVGIALAVRGPTSHSALPVLRS